MFIDRVSIAAKLKRTTIEAFPSLWVHWRLMRRPDSAEIELSALKKIVRREDITVDVGANFGLYARELARLCFKVHAVEPSQTMASILKRTTSQNVIVHAMALSDHEGYAELRTPRSGRNLIHSLATLEPDATMGEDCVKTRVRCARLDAIIHDNVSFVKVDVEGHELSVLRGAEALIARSQPVFLVEAEERHRLGATAALFAFFKEKNYSGFFLRGRNVEGIENFDASADQDEAALLNDGGRQHGRNYINNFFFFPTGRGGLEILRAA